MVQRISQHPVVWITGTGTGVGKTVATGTLLGACLRAGLPALSMKWIQTGLSEDPLDCAIHDQLALPNPPLPPPGRRTVFQAGLAASPHLAFREAVNPPTIEACLVATQAFQPAHFPILVEGAGGICVPISTTITTLDWMKLTGYPVVLVTTTALGTLNATRLTVDRLVQDGIHILGIWITPTGGHPDVVSDNQKMIESLGYLTVSAPWIPYTDAIG